MIQNNCRNLTSKYFAHLSKGVLKFSMAQCISRCCFRTTCRFRSQLDVLPVLPAVRQCTYCCIQREKRSSGTKVVFFKYSSITTIVTEVAMSSLHRKSAACHATPQCVRRVPRESDRHEAYTYRSGAEDGDACLMLAEIAGRIDGDAHMRSDDNEVSQAEVLHMGRNKDVRYSGSFHVA